MFLDIRNDKEENRKANQESWEVKKVWKALLKQFSRNPRPKFDDALKAARKGLKLNSNTLNEKTVKKWWTKFEAGDTFMRVNHRKSSVLIPVEFGKFLKLLFSNLIWFTQF